MALDVSKVSVPRDLNLESLYLGCAFEAVLLKGNQKGLKRFGGSRSRLDPWCEESYEPGGLGLQLRGPNRLETRGAPRNGLGCFSTGPLKAF